MKSSNQSVWFAHVFTIPLLIRAVLQTRHDLGYRVNTGKPGRLIARFHSYYKSVAYNEWSRAISLPGLPVFTQYPRSRLLQTFHICVLYKYQNQTRTKQRVPPECLLKTYDFLLPISLGFSDPPSHPLRPLYCRSHPKAEDVINHKRAATNL